MLDEKNVDGVDNTEDELVDNPTDNDEGTDTSEGVEEPEEQMGGDLEGDGDGDDTGNEGDESAEDRQARKDRAQAQIARLKEENRKLKEEKRKAEREGKVGNSNSDMMAKAFLASTYDIKETDAQDEAIRLADKFDMSVDELMDDPDYRSKITGLQKRLVQNRKVASNTGGASQRKKNAEYYAEYFKKHQSFPEDLSLDMRDEALNHLSGKQKQAWQR